MNVNTAQTALDAVQLVQQLVAAANSIMTLPGFGTAAGVSRADLEGLRLQEPAAQALLEQTIANMPNDAAEADAAARP